MTGFNMSVLNFGPIRSGEVDIRPLTVFTGTNDTGKSWMATLLYSVCNLDRMNESEWRLQNFIEEQLKEFGKATSFPENIQKWVSDIETYDTIQLSTMEKKLLESCLSRNALFSIMEIDRCFGFNNSSEAIRWKSRNGANVDIFSFDRRDKQSTFLDYEITKEKVKVDNVIQNNIYLNNKTKLKNYILEILHESKKDLFYRYSTKLFKVLIEYVYLQQMGVKGSLYIPGCRSGVTEAFQSIVASAIQNYYDWEDEFTKRPRPLNGATIDFVQRIASIKPDDPNEVNENGNKLASRIEERVLNGKILVKHNIVGFPYIYFKPNDQRNEIVPLNLSSSTVSQLASVVLFLRYFASKNHLIILEEPEIHLHPEKQVTLLHEIVLMVRAGYKILVTTHSEWFTETLSNIVAFKGRNSLPEISVKDIGVWNFEHKKNSSGSIIKEVKWNIELGGFDTEFEEVSRNLYNDWIDAIGESK